MERRLYKKRQNKKREVLEMRVGAEEGARINPLIDVQEKNGKTNVGGVGEGSPPIISPLTPGEGEVKRDAKLETEA